MAKHRVTTCDMHVLSLYESAVRDLLLRPIGMTRSTTSAREMERDANRCVGHEDGRPVGASECDDIDALAPSGCLRSTGRDMMKWVQVMLDDGCTQDGTPLVRPETLAKLVTPNFDAVDEDGEPSGYAVGWGAQPIGAVTAVTHAGSFDSQSSVLAFYPELGLGLVVLCNGDGSEDGLADLVDLLAELAQGMGAPRAAPRPKKKKKSRRRRVFNKLKKLFWA
eukprot:TRINITY_DN22380_c0_g1_i1.p1 TRINITY_DN22380_c0_g1~~TRINITY_DN22380_c0_g1_i1.p1  ORF type:complete len:257 (+),score=70.26 TRINITY_DN22380_c0_g1_i1:107-772(+)